MASQYPHPLVLTNNSFPPPGATNSTITEILNRFCSSINFPIRILGCSVKEGGNNVIILCYAVFTSPVRDTLPSPISCILRIGKLRWNLHDYVDPGILEMAAFHHVMGNTSPLIPSIYAWDATCVNLLGCPYVIQPLIAGHDLQTLYTPLSGWRHPIETRIRFAHEIARCIAHIESFRFENYGTFAVSARMPEKCSDPSSPSISELIGFSPIPWTANLFMRKDTKIGHFLIDILTSQLNDARSPAAEERHGILVPMACELNELEHTHSLTQNGEPAVLWHPDFWPRNIMMEKNEQDVKITGVIDWDGVMIVPRIMTRRAPVFLWDEGDELSVFERNIIKYRFDQRIEQLLPGYCSDAYSDWGNMTRAIATHALKGVDWNYCELSFGALMELWNDFVGNA
ncbi:uncharacterized protein EAF01_009718 [Botrytis porri]|uniref:Aminoglycoside phosphotransferase domain-containing protein n=1 Tax=Botrytis porri TaxID=87229 RepID=A0A4Z1KGX2_9HELO|nr:uncharacterized protein EAF01_009718 [Botrytis porri]KAF7895756.1 hypothetical protein EAF01_009718 [Botrytis porri]TGO84788.1 hypothetical protein BPOR_0465g00020 [Botrytis porri]